MSTESNNQYGRKYNIMVSDRNYTEFVNGDLQHRIFFMVMLQYTMAKQIHNFFYQENLIMARLSRINSILKFLEMEATIMDTSMMI